MAMQTAWKMYEKLGFEVFDGAEEQNWLILRNRQIHLGLFQEMFPKNVLTFRPDDVRALQRELKANGVKLDQEAAAEGTGTTSLMLTDPDGNPIVMDQPMTPQERAIWDEMQRTKR